MRFVFGFALDVSDEDLLDIDLSDTALDLFDTDINFFPVIIFWCRKRLEDMP